MTKRAPPVVRVRKVVVAADRPDLENGWIPRLDLVETGTALVVAMEAAGLGAGDLEISLQSSRLEVRGRKPEAAVPAGTRYFRLEREYGPFRRTLALPLSVVPDRARATLENGVLTIVLPKRAGARDRGRIVRIKTIRE